jgi:hypothetical protein
MSGEASAPPVALLALLDVELPVPNRRERLPSDGLSHGQRRGFFPQGAHEAIQKLSEKPHERAKRLTIKRVIATYISASPVSGTLS